jgi:hypothetical protein
MGLGVRYAGNHYLGLPGLQTAELQHDEEPPEELRAFGVQQVLPVVPETYGTQGEQVSGRWHRWIGASGERCIDALDALTDRCNQGSMRKCVDAIAGVRGQ